MFPYPRIDPPPPLDRGIVALRRERLSRLFRQTGRMACEMLSHMA
jgi:hypothetical protein